MTLPDFLTQDEDGEIRLTGHRIGLYTVVRYAQAGYSAEQIRAELPSLEPVLVDQVLHFTRENQAEVEAYVTAYRAELERQEAAHIHSPAELEVRRFLDSQMGPEAIPPAKNR